MGLVSNISGSSVPVIAADSPIGLAPPKINSTEVETIPSNGQSAKLILRLEEAGEIGGIGIPLTG